MLQPLLVEAVVRAGMATFALECSTGSGRDQCDPARSPELFMTSLRFMVSFVCTPLGALDDNKEAFASTKDRRWPRNPGGRFS